jgi:hypothetical protein
VNRRRRFTTQRCIEWHVFRVERLHFVTQQLVSGTRDARNLPSPTGPLFQLYDTEASSIEPSPFHLQLDTQKAEPSSSSCTQEHSHELYPDAHSISPPRAPEDRGQFEQARQAVHLGQDRRRHPRNPRRLLRLNHCPGDTGLDSHDLCSGPALRPKPARPLGPYVSPFLGLLSAV